MKDLVKQGFDKNLVSLGFYPIELSKDEKTMKIANTNTGQELHFELEDYSFETVKVEDFKDTPKDIKEVVKKDKRSWFESYEIVYPKEDEKPIDNDPFLLGVKEGKRYYISSWNTGIWDSI